MKVKDIMTIEAVKQCGPETKLHEAAKLMKSANCGALPVVDKNRKVLGIITDRDIALSLAKSPGASATEFSVKDVMSSQVYTVAETDDITVALEKMRTKKVGRLPVVNKENHLQGIVSIHNLLSNSSEEEIRSPKNVQGESVYKTIKALSDRYSQASTK